MPSGPQIFLYPVEEYVIAGAGLNFRALIISDCKDDSLGDEEECLSAFFRLLGIERFVLFESGKGPSSNSRVFLDTVFTLKESLVSMQKISPKVTVAHCRFILPKSIPSSFSMPSDICYGNQNSYLDSSSGISYKLSISYRPSSVDFIGTPTRQQIGSISNSKSYEPVPPLAESSCYASTNYDSKACSTTFHVSPYISRDDPLFLRGTLTKNMQISIPGIKLFSESKSINTTVSLDQYVVYAETPFPLTLTCINETNKAVTGLSVRLKTTIHISLGDRTRQFANTLEINAREDLAVSAGQSVIDKILWVELGTFCQMSCSSPIPSSPSSLRITHDLVFVLLIEGKEEPTVELSLPIFIARGLNVSETKAQKDSSCQPAAALASTPRPSSPSHHAEPNIS